MYIKRIHGAVLCCALVAWGCSNSTAAAAWPPEAIPKNELTTDPSEPVQGEHRVEGAGYVYQDEALTKRDRHDPWGFYLVEGEWDLNSNLFQIPGPDSRGFVSNQYEVVYLSDELTRIRLNPDNGDRLLLASFRDEFSEQKVLTTTFAGSTVRYRDRTLKLKASGWYEGEECVRPFQSDSENK